MFLDRSNSTSVTLVTEQNSGEELLNTGDLDFGARTALWFSLARQRCDCWGWDLGFVGLGSWHTRRVIDSELSPVLQLPGGIPLPATAPGTVLATDYGMDFYSSEFNVRYRPWDCVTLLTGFRWVEAGDMLSVRQRIGTQSRDLLSVDTNNHMYGWQLGADYELFARRHWSVAATTRAGLFYNHADQTTEAPVLSGINGVVDRVRADDDHAAFLGEIGVQGELRLSRTLSVTGGYRLYWLEGLALAPDQLLTTSLLAPGSAGVANGGSLFLNGATVALNVTF
jgi:hypothetical protein